MSVTHMGDITSDNGEGIVAFSDSGMVTTVSTGKIVAEDEGIYAQNFGAGAVSVMHTGDIESTKLRKPISCYRGWGSKPMAGIMLGELGDEIH